MSVREVDEGDRLRGWIEELLAGHAEELAARALSIRFDFDPGLPVDRDADLGEALQALLRLILGTVPDDCVVDLSTVRSTAPVSKLGSGIFTARWQVPDASRRAGGGALAPIHPRPGTASDHASSPLARRTREGFERAGWSFDLEILAGGGELLARATRRSAGARVRG